MEVMLQCWRDACFKGMSLSLSPAQISSPLSIASVFLHCSIFKAPLFVSFSPPSHDYVFELSRVITFPLCWFASAIEFSLLLSLQAWMKAHRRQLKFSYWLLEGTVERRKREKQQNLTAAFCCWIGDGSSDFSWCLWQALVALAPWNLSTIFEGQRCARPRRESTTMVLWRGHLPRGKPPLLTLNFGNNLRQMQVTRKGG